MKAQNTTTGVQAFGASAQEIGNMAAATTTVATATLANRPSACRSSSSRASCFRRRTPYSTPATPQTAPIIAPPSAANNFARRPAPLDPFAALHVVAAAAAPGAPTDSAVATTAAVKVALGAVRLTISPARARIAA